MFVYISILMTLIFVLQAFTVIWLNRVSQQGKREGSGVVELEENLVGEAIAGALDHVFDGLGQIAFRRKGGLDLNLVGERLGGRGGSLRPELGPGGVGKI